MDEGAPCTRRLAIGTRGKTAARDGSADRGDRIGEATAS